MPKYDDITPEEFQSGLWDVVSDACEHPADLLSIPGVYEILSEYFNNEVLEALRPDGEDEEEAMNEITVYDKEGEAYSGTPQALIGSIESIEARAASLTEQVLDALTFEQVLDVAREYWGLPMTEAKAVDHAKGIVLNPELYDPPVSPLGAAIAARVYNMAEDRKL